MSPIQSIQAREGLFSFDFFMGGSTDSLTVIVAAITPHGLWARARHVVSHLILPAELGGDAVWRRPRPAYVYMVSDDLKARVPNH